MCLQLSYPAGEFTDKASQKISIAVYRRVIPVLKLLVLQFEEGNSFSLFTEHRGLSSDIAFSLLQFYPFLLPVKKFLRHGCRIFVHASRRTFVHSPTSRLCVSVRDDELGVERKRLPGCFFCSKGADA